MSTACAPTAGADDDGVHGRLLLGGYEEPTAMAPCLTKEERVYEVGRISSATSRRRALSSGTRTRGVEEAAGLRTGAKATEAWQPCAWEGERCADLKEGGEQVRER